MIEADADECAAHAVLLAEIDKASGGKTVWRALEPPVEALAVAA